ncbi:MAG: rhomboid family intramembrane serine protease [Candidatus Azobacteroides sp.]|nr:rhomboid family intramembrane serine protease [Candidatus Azobacteroides sp.]
MLWLIEILKAGMEWNLSFLGILPLSLKGLIGIPFHFFVHSDMSHLWNNTLPILTLGWLLFYFYNQIAWRAILSIMITTGVLLWFIGRPGIHMGASGLIYGLTFFLIFSGILRRYAPLMAVSLVVVFLYGSTTWGIFPFAEIIKPNLSWEGHLSGAISGLLTALMLRKEGPQKPLIKEDEDEEDEDNELKEQDHIHYHPMDDSVSNVS